MKKILSIIAIIAAFVVGFFVAKQFFSPRTTTSTETNSKVLLTKINEVAKLITIEGNFVEHFDETNHKEVTLYLPFPTYWKFDKRAIIEVSGNVMVGYDLQKMSIAVDSASRTISLGDFPDPEIMSIDHDIEYKFLEESFFNNFTAKDYTTLNKNAKAVLEKAAKEAKLLEKATEQGNQMIDVIHFMAEAAGWKVEIKAPTMPDAPFLD